MSWFFLVLIVAAAALVYLQARASWWLAFLIVWVAAAHLSGAAAPLATAILAIVFVLPALVLTVKPLRRAWLSKPVLEIFRKILPEMSPTERDAIEAGTVWWDAALFSGRPHWDTLLGHGPARLTAEEQSFLDVECQHLCDLANDWETTAIWQDLSPQTWQYIKERGFLGMIIPKQYGGKQFSAYAHSQVIMKLATRCSAAAVSVMVPNSLGPAELLMHYGTEEQKNYYLPRLARGVEIPCFALTSPYAGSDAAAIPDIGIVCKGSFEGRETLGFRVTWDKRYITLGPIATVLGLAFRALDPDHLLGSADEPGITCALIPTSHPGVNIGRRHWPLNAVFQNGPNSGKDVFIPLDWVIGGRAQVGNGWRMLMECLAAGRAISLPSSNVGMAKIAVRGTGAYAAVRRQFRTAVGKFEGVQEALGRMGGNLYVMDAARRLSAHAVDLGEKPSVISAIAKYHITERARKVVNDGMDVVAGKGICMGPSNFLARAYQQVPISITVEGANILTRCLIIFGQGAIRCHPYVLKEMAATREDRPRQSAARFRRGVLRPRQLYAVERGTQFRLRHHGRRIHPQATARLCAARAVLPRSDAHFHRVRAARRCVDVRAGWRSETARADFRAAWRCAVAALPHLRDAQALRRRRPPGKRSAARALGCRGRVTSGAGGHRRRARQLSEPSRRGPRARARVSVRSAAPRAIGQPRHRDCRVDANTGRRA